MPTNNITRRRVVQGIAWSTPAIAATAAAPAYAASGPCDAADTWADWMAAQPGYPLTFDPATGTWTYIATGTPGIATSGDWAELVYSDGTILKVGVVVERDEYGEPIVPDNLLGPDDQQVVTIQTALPLSQLVKVSRSEYHRNTGLYWMKTISSDSISPDGCGFGGGDGPNPCDDPVQSWYAALTNGTIRTDDYAVSYADGKITFAVSSLADGVARYEMDVTDSNAETLVLLEAVAGQSPSGDLDVQSLEAVTIDGLDEDGRLVSRFGAFIDYQDNCAVAFQDVTPVCDPERVWTMGLLVEKVLKLSDDTYDPPVSINVSYDEDGLAAAVNFSGYTGGADAPYTYTLRIFDSEDNEIVTRDFTAFEGYEVYPVDIPGGIAAVSRMQVTSAFPDQRPGVSVVFDPGSCSLVSNDLLSHG